MSRSIQLRFRWVLVVVLGAFTGCVELGLIPPPGGGPTPPSSNNGGDSGDGGETIPTVRLTVSNSAPQVNEEVVLRCESTNGPPGPVSYDFQLSYGGSRLQENASQGTASFIIQETDVGVAVTATCTGTNANGTGNSTPIVIVATMAPSLPDTP